MSDFRCRLMRVALPVGGCLSGALTSGLGCLCQPDVWALVSALFGARHRQVGRSNATGTESRSLVPNAVTRWLGWERDGPGFPQILGVLTTSSKPCSDRAALSLLPACWRLSGLDELHGHSGSKQCHAVGCSGVASGSVQFLGRPAALGILLPMALGMAGESGLLAVARTPATRMVEMADGAGRSAQGVSSTVWLELS